MRNPYRNLSSNAQAVAIFATILVVSLGLCGINAAAFNAFDLPVSGGTGTGP